MRDEDDAAYGRAVPDMSSTCPGLMRDKDAAAVELVERHCERLRSTFAPQAGGPSVAGEIRVPSPPSLSQCSAAVSQPCLTLFSRPGAALGDLALNPIKFLSGGHYIAI